MFKLSHLMILGGLMVVMDMAACNKHQHITESSQPTPESRKDAITNSSSSIKISDYQQQGPIIQEFMNQDGSGLVENSAENSALARAEQTPWSEKQEQQKRSSNLMSDNHHIHQQDESNFASFGDLAPPFQPPEHQQVNRRFHHKLQHHKNGGVGKLSKHSHKLHHQLRDENQYYQQQQYQNNHYHKEPTITNYPKYENPVLTIDPSYGAARLPLLTGIGGYHYQENSYHLRAPSQEDTSYLAANSATHDLSHSTSKFPISEIVCTVVALAIVALIVGAPIFLIYLVIMGTFNGSSGSLSLINTVAPNTASIMGSLSNAMRRRSSAETRNKKGSWSSNDFMSLLSGLFVDSPKVAEISKRLLLALEKFSKI